MARPLFMTAPDAVIPRSRPNLRFSCSCRSGMVLRITESAEGSSSSGGDYSGPRPPPSSSSETTGKWYVQGTLLEVRRDKLVVAFDEVDWWPLDDPGESYQCVVVVVLLACFIPNRLRLR